VSDCDIHPFCQDQGCNADPDHCQRAQDLRAMRKKNADEAALARHQQFERNRSLADAD
jgi:hypothetical protein